MPESSPPDKLKQSRKTTILIAIVMVSILGLGWVMAVESLVQNDRYWDERLSNSDPDDPFWYQDELLLEEGSIFHSRRFRSSPAQVLGNSIRMLPHFRFIFTEIYVRHPFLVIFFFLLEVGILWLGYVTVKDDRKAEQNLK